MIQCRLYSFIKEAAAAKRAEEARKAEEAAAAKRAEEVRKAEEAKAKLREEWSKERSKENHLDELQWKQRRSENEIKGAQAKLDRAEKYLAQHEAELPQLESFRRGYKGHFRQGELSWRDMEQDAFAWVEETSKKEKEAREALSKLDGHKSFINEGLLYSRDVDKWGNEMSVAKQDLDKARKAKDDKAISAAHARYKTAEENHDKSAGKLSYYKHLEKEYPAQEVAAKQVLDAAQKEYQEAKDLLEAIENNSYQEHSIRRHQGDRQSAQETLAQHNEELEKIKQELNTGS